jgi:hypothetical protein
MITPPVGVKPMHEAASSNADARLAIQMFCYSVRKQVAAMIAALTFAGVSRRLAGVPMSLKSSGGLSATFSGTGTRAASAARSPYLALRPVGW